MLHLQFFNWQKVGLFILFFAFPFFLFSQGNSDNQFLKKITQQKAELNQGQLNKLERLQGNPMNKNVQLVQVGNLKALQNRGALPIKVPGRKGALVAHATSIEAITDTDFIWNGEFRKEEHGYITIIAKNGTIYGQINIENEIYTLQDLGNGKNALIQLDESKYGPNECATPHGRTSNAHDNSSNKAKARGHCNSNVRVLVLFTNAANLVGNPLNDATLFINQTNQACRNSAVTQHDLNFELVGVQELVGFIENPDAIQDDLDGLRALGSNARNLRNLFDADLVVLLTDGNYNNNNTVGVAFLDDFGNDDFGYAIAEIDAAGGRFTFAHEVAHLFGARHDTDNRVEPFLSPFAHGHNFKTGGFLGLFRKTRRTILNFAGEGDSRIQHFSNPDVQFDGGDTGTTDERDNARQLVDRACDLADYRDFAAPMSVVITGPTTIIDGSSNTWCANVADCDNVTSYTWAWSDNGFTYYNFGYSSCVTRSSFATTANSVFLRVISNCGDGQTATDFHTVNIDSDTQFRIINNGSNDISEPISINTFPNPSSDYIDIRIDLDKPSSTNIYLTDMMGRRVKSIYKGKMEKGTHFLHETTSNYEQGFYTIVLETKEVTKTARIIIQK